MNSFGKFLRTTREGKGISLEDVASATRINKKFLEDIEEGTMQNIPAAYARVFIRAYAEELGLDPQEMLKLSESAESESIYSFTDQQPSSMNIAMRDGSVAGEQQFGGMPGPGQNKQVKVLLVFSLLLLTGLLASLYWLHEQYSVSPAEETAFQDLVNEWNAKYSKPAQPSGPLSDAMAESSEKDSLVLACVASDSVWLRLTIDGSQAREYRMKPQQRLRWVAKNIFHISVGNTGAVTFTLDGQSLGMVGKKGTSASNITIDRKTLEAIQQRSGKPIAHEKH
jgi:transcriptional regulator with XRE-family HTH domain